MVMLMNITTSHNARQCFVKLKDCRKNITVKGHNLALSGRLLGLGLRLLDAYFCCGSWAQKFQRAASEA